jgi:hypothetical protein
VGLRLNKSPPDVVVEKKATGGVKFSHTVPLTKLGPEPGKTMCAAPRRWGCLLHGARCATRGVGAGHVPVWVVPRE